MMSDYVWKIKSDNNSGLEKKVSCFQIRSLPHIPRPYVLALVVLVDIMESNKTKQLNGVHSLNITHMGQFPQDRIFGPLMSKSLVQLPDCTQL